MHENIVWDSLNKINPSVVDAKMNNRLRDKNRHLVRLRFGIQIIHQRCVLCMCYIKICIKYSNLEAGLILVTKPITLLKLNLQQPCIFG